MGASRPSLSIADTPWVGLHNHNQPQPQLLLLLLPALLPAGKGRG